MTKSSETTITITEADLERRIAARIAEAVAQLRGELSATAHLPGPPRLAPLAGDRGMLGAICQMIDRDRRGRRRGRHAGEAQPNPCVRPTG